MEGFFRGSRASTTSKVGTKIALYIKFKIARLRNGEYVKYPLDTRGQGEKWYGKIWYSSC